MSYQFSHSDVYWIQANRKTSKLYREIFYIIRIYFFLNLSPRFKNLGSHRYPLNLTLRPNLRPNSCLRHAINVCKIFGSELDPMKIKPTLDGFSRE